MKKRVVIEFDAPSGSNKETQAEFITDALGHWGGQFSPEDPFFESLRSGFKIISLTKAPK